ncbi:hypothetical protein EDD98_6133 [Streptomyces sp. PanSC19]|nr:hypothetical protein EDD98_6133 [Streptomyces sp. PanSC19]
MRVGITGHRGLGAEVELRVRAMLDEAGGGYGAAELTAVSCIADGPDSWLAEAVLEHGGRLEVVIPATEYRENLPEWRHPTYDAFMSRAADVHGTGLIESTSEAHQAGSEILVGLVDEPIAVWDGKPAWAFGGTADVVAYAQRTGVPVRILWPEGATRWPAVTLLSSSAWVTARAQRARPPPHQHAEAGVARAVLDPVRGLAVDDDALAEPDLGEPAYSRAFRIRAPICFRRT